MKIRVKTSARRDMLKLPDIILIKAFRTILDIQNAPYPRGFGKVQGRRDRFRVWMDRDYRIIYEVDSTAGVIDIVQVGIKNERTYKRS